ncbi:MAG: glycosyltransferase [Rhodoplanes sp.]|uniref:glycosyltransferase family 2 protein n=1 Tax=Rhodoplanes sp. TaxID=1968906 RepID=UPI0017D61D26|nr:glycosyltransferase [Rhodoplanes sp.]NVO14985.1 glycosyltransferase [Rhodoplanes sp.]
MTIRVSVVMPVRDGGPWVREAVESVLAQDFGAFELIAVDDGSTDDTPAILAEAAARDARVRVLQPQGRGLVAALTCAVAAAQGAYLARLDADDVAAPGRLGRQLAVMEARPALGLLGSWADKIDQSGAPIGRLTPETDPHKLVDLLARTNPFIHSSLMLRTELVRSLGSYRAAFEAAEDYDLWLRVAEVAEVANLPEALIRYRWHPGNVTSRKEVRQCFSVRLAQHAAAARRAGRPDPAAALASPPDWTDPACDAAFFAEDARLYRVLALADPDTAPAGSTPVDLAPLLSPSTPLSHRERKLAQRALATLLRRPDLAGGTGAAELLWHAVRLHPARAASLAWRYFTGATA